MASLTKRPTSKNWVACFTDINGRRLKRSTGTVNRKLALKLADEFEEAARKRRTMLQVRRVLGDLHTTIAGETVSATSVKEFVDRWLARKKPEVALSTYEFYDGSIRRFLEFLPTPESLDISEVTRQQITDYRNSLATNISPKTVNHRLKSLRMLFKDARRDGLLVDDPTEFVEVIRGHVKSEVRPFTLDELKSVLAVAKPEWRSMVLFAIYTGQRLADIAALTWNQLDLEKGEIRVRTRKNGKLLILPIPAPLKRHIESLPAGDDPEQPLHQHAHETLTRLGRAGTLSRDFGDLLALAGLREKSSHSAVGKGRSVRRKRNALTFHSLRRTTTSLLHEAGIPQSVAKDYVGHDSTGIHETYVSIGKDALKLAAAALPDLTSPS